MSLAAYFLLLARSLCSRWLWKTNVEKILGKQCLYLFWGTSSVDNEIIVFQFSLLPSHKDMFPNPRGNIIFINHLSRFTFNSYSSILEDFPGHPLVKTSCFQCRVRGFDPTCQAVQLKDKNKERIFIKTDLQLDRDTKKLSETPLLCKVWTFILWMCLLNMLCISSLVNYCLYSSSFFLINLNPVFF